MSWAGVDVRLRSPTVKAGWDGFETETKRRRLVLSNQAAPPFHFPDRIVAGDRRRREHALSDQICFRARLLVRRGGLCRPGSRHSDRRIVICSLRRVLGDAIAERPVFLLGLD